MQLATRFFFVGAFDARPARRRRDWYSAGAECRVPKHSRHFLFVISSTTNHHHITMATATSESDAAKLIPAAQTALQAKSDEELRVPFYCEENVWRIAYRRHAAQSPPTRQHWVVFISNERGLVAMQHQKALRGDNVSCWDYHVVLFARDPGQSIMVYDVDSTLSYPCPLDEYLEQSFPSNVFRRYQPQFRMINAQTYLEDFSSDRRHMIKDGEWQQPPPPYPCIEPNANNTFDFFRDFRPHRSDTITLEQLRKSIQPTASSDS